MKGVIFHTLKNSNLTNNIRVDVSNIISYRYSKRVFKILDTNNDYKLCIEYYNPMKRVSLFDILIGDAFLETEYIYLPTERRCMNEINEIMFKRKKLEVYIDKLNNEIIPIEYGKISYNSYNYVYEKL